GNSCNLLVPGDREQVVKLCEAFVLFVELPQLVLDLIETCTSKFFLTLR
ncbi:hypothetical protein Godav_004250, partial [Gossypium davidsonii]|nr:hypothetical protein [Gossypium davidsonii]